MKLAFLFLTVGRIHPLWQDFFQYANKSQYSIYIHAKFPERFRDNYFKPFLIPGPIPTRWGDISQIRALLLLLQHAYRDPSNAKFLYCSESCIPLLAFPIVYRKLVTAVDPNKGFLHWYRLHPERHKGLGDRSYISYSRFMKMRGQGWCFPKKLVPLLIRHDDSGIFEQVTCPTEHYFVNCFLHHNISLPEYFDNRALTYFNWSSQPQPQKGKRKSQLHPKTYHYLTSELRSECLDKGFLFLRKVSF